MITTQDIDTTTGDAIRGRDGNKIGSVGQVYLDNASGNPEWVTVKTGLLGGNSSFVPVAQATVAGGHLTAPFGRATVKDDPRIDDDAELTPTQVDQLCSYYGMPSTPGAPTTTTGTGRPVDTDPNSHGMVDAEADATGAVVGTRTGRTGTEGHDTSGSYTDDAMTRSEEQLHVGTRTEQGELDNAGHTGPTPSTTSSDRRLP